MCDNTGKVGCSVGYVENATIYELKPYNPKAMEAGRKQLQIYLEEIKQIPEFQGMDWKTVLDTY